MGARVIGCMDMLRLGDLKSHETREIASEVARGIAGYGNPLGVPNLGGDTVFDSSYNTNCLVNAIAFGIVREDEIIHSFVPAEAADVGYDIILIGKPTDRSGFGGASFASVSMEEEKREQNTGAVQEPNPFLERHLLASTYALFDWLAANKHLDKISFKDLGAGGVVCSTVEQVAEKGFGADIDLEKVHVSIDGLSPEVIACAETQERFCWMCHPLLTEHIVKHYNVNWALPTVAENARASVIGKVTKGNYRVLYQGVAVCDASAEAVTSGLQYTRPTKIDETVRSEPSITSQEDRIILHTNGAPFETTIQNVFEAMLSHPNYASKDPFMLHYDKTVIGNGIIEAGEADAGVIQPLQDLQSHIQGGSHPGWDLPESDRKIGVAVAADGNPRYGKISAYWQGAMAAVESMCNVASSGATPRALTDCLNYGNPEIPEHLASLEQGVQGIADACRGVQVDGEAVPVISGNVSLYNSLPDGRSIPPSAIVCAIGVLPDVEKTVSMQFKKANSTILLLGEPKAECGGSAYYEVLEHMAQQPSDSLLGANLPKPDFGVISRSINFLRDAISQGLLLASHDVSDGGLLLALFEMTLPQRRVGGIIGAEVDLENIQSQLRTDELCFTQIPMFVLESDAFATAALEEVAKRHNVQLSMIGKTIDQAHLSIKRGNISIIDSPLQKLRETWKNGLAKALSV
jgi:phosphoribosylformylglycinamidine synthase